MLAGIRSRLTYANVVSTLCLFILLGGGAWAAATINTGDVVNNSLKSVDLKDGKGVKAADVAPGELVTPGSEGWTPLVLNAPAETCGWQDHGNAAYFRDPAGIVHLRGSVQAVDGTDDACGASPVQDRLVSSSLPPGYRPPQAAGLPVVSNNTLGQITVFENEDGIWTAPDFPTFANAKQWVQLDGISWRCGPSGVDGCP